MSKLISENANPPLNQEIIETQQQFIKRALISRDKAKKTGKYSTHEEVMTKLREKLALAKATKN